jgi:hypothetical protein
LPKQSTAGRVKLQYRLIDRASSLGWPRDRIKVIDDDLGKSGASSAARYGTFSASLRRSALLLKIDSDDGRAFDRGPAAGHASERTPNWFLRN